MWEFKVIRKTAEKIFLSPIHKKDIRLDVFFILRTWQVRVCHGWFQYEDNIHSWQNRRCIIGSFHFLREKVEFDD